MLERWVLVGQENRGWYTWASNIIGTKQYTDTCSHCYIPPLIYPFAIILYCPVYNINIQIWILDFGIELWEFTPSVGLQFLCCGGLLASLPPIYSILSIFYIYNQNQENPFYEVTWGTMQSPHNLSASYQNQHGSTALEHVKHGRYAFQVEDPEGQV